MDGDSRRSAAIAAVAVLRGKIRRDGDGDLVAGCKTYEAGNVDSKPTKAITFSEVYWFTLLGMRLQNCQDLLSVHPT